MLSISRKTDYALVALAGLVSDGRAGMSAHGLAQRLRLPFPALRNILKALTHHGLLISAKGSRGGYRLARSPEEITLAEVIRAVEGPPRLTLCCSIGPDGQEDHQCYLEDSCRIKRSVRTVHHNLLEFLARVTLAQIASDHVAETKTFGSERDPAYPAGSERQSLHTIGSDER